MLQHGACVIPTSRTHAADNADLFGFELSGEDLRPELMVSGEGNTPQCANALGVSRSRSERSVARSFRIRVTGHPGMKAKS